MNNEVKDLYISYFVCDYDMDLLIRELRRDIWLSHPNSYLAKLLRFIELGR